MTGTRACRVARSLVRVGVAAATALVLMASAALGQVGDDEPATDAGGLVLVDQTMWVEPDSTFELTLRAPGVYNFDDQLLVTVHERVEDVAGVQASFTGDELGDALGTVTTTLGALTPSPEGEITVEIRLSDGTDTDAAETAAGEGDADEGGRDETPTVVVANPGVYPVAVSLRTADQALLGRIVTHVVRIPGGDGVVTPMPVATVVDLHAGPSGGPGSAPDAAQLARIQRWVGPLQATGLAATLRLDPWLLDAPGTIGLPEELRRLVAGRELARAPWVRVDEAALADARLDPVSAELWILGDQTTERELGVQPTPGLWVADGENPPSRRRYGELADLGITAVVVPHAAVSDLPPRPEPGRGTLEVGGDSFAALVALGSTAEALDGADDPVLAAHHLIAELSVRAFAGEPSATLLFGSDQDIDPQAVALVVGGLANSPLHAPSAAGALLAGAPAVTAGPGMVPIDGAVPALEGDTEVLDQAFATLNGYRSMVFDPDTDRLYDQLRSDLLVALSSDVDPATRDLVARQTTSRILQEVDAITPPPPIEVLLTAPDGVVPFSFESALDYPVRVEVGFLSDKVTFVGIDDGETATLVLEPGVTTEEFEVRALTSGRFPLEVVMRSPDGTLLLGDQRVNVRSTALSGIGIAVAVGAGTFLLVWWVVQWRRRRTAPAAVDEPFWTATRLPDEVGART